MFSKKFLLVFILILCFITTVNANDISEDNFIQNSNSELYGAYVNPQNNSNDNDFNINVVKDKSKSNSGTTVTKKTSTNSKSNMKINKRTRVWISHMNIKKNHVIVSLKSNKKGIIYYTTDGSKPTLRSKKYQYPIKLSSKNVLKYLIVDRTGVSSKVFKYKRILGKTSKGYVEKLYYGNLSSDKTIALIVGVHVQESGMHKSIQHGLKLKNSKLSRRFVLYYIHVTKDKGSYDKSRMNGQILAKKFIKSDISSENPKIVTDVHETRYKISGYKYPRFIHIISTNARPGVKVSKKLYKKSVVYLNRILRITPHLKRYDPPPTGSSPPYVTIPIANKGFVAYVYETEASYSTKTKQRQAEKYILALDKINLLVK